MAFDQHHVLILCWRNELDRVDAETATVMLSRTALYPLPNRSARTLIFFCSFLRHTFFVLCSSRSTSQGVKPSDVLISDCSPFRSVDVALLVYNDRLSSIAFCLVAYVQIFIGSYLRASACVRVLIAEESLQRLRFPFRSSIYLKLIRSKDLYDSFWKF